MQKCEKDRFLIDGFPRSQDNLDGWTREMAGKVDLKFVLYFDCPQDECVKRCLERGEGGSGRSDDNPASLEKRVVTYTTVTEPIINHFIGLDMVRKVDAASDVDTVSPAMHLTNQIRVLGLPCMCGTHSFLRTGSSVFPRPSNP